MQVSIVWWLADILLYWLQCAHLWILVPSGKPFCLEHEVCGSCLWWSSYWWSYSQNYSTWRFKVDIKIVCLIIILCLFSNTELIPPYPVHDQASTVHSTYLDTIGRPVIIAKGYNLVEQQILDFQVSLALCYHYFIIVITVVLWLWVVLVASRTIPAHRSIVPFLFIYNFSCSYWLFNH